MKEISLPILINCPSIIMPFSVNPVPSVHWPPRFTPIVCSHHFFRQNLPSSIWICISKFPGQNPGRHNYIFDQISNSLFPISTLPDAGKQVCLLVNWNRSSLQGMTTFKCFMIFRSVRYEIVHPVFLSQIWEN